MTAAVDARAHKRKRAKLTAILFLLMAMAALLGLTGYYMVNIATGSVDMSGAPKYERSIYGSTGTGALGQPMGIDVDDEGNLYVIDTSRSRVQVYDREGLLTASFPREKTKQKLVNPLYVAVNRKKEVFVSDRGQGKILVFTSNGRFLREFKPKGKPDFQWAPVGMAFDKDNTFYVSDFSTQQIRVFNPSGELVRTLGRPGEELGEFQFPNGIALSKDRVFVADSNNGRIQMFDKKSGGVISQFPAGSLPRGIALDDVGRIFVVDTLDHQIKVHRASDGRFLFGFSSLGQGEGQLLFPNSIAFDGDYNMYVSDRENNRVSLWSYGAGN